MSIAPVSKADRRRIADEFKERKVPRGIFAITCAATGEKWVGTSPNLSAAQKLALVPASRGSLSQRLVTAGVEAAQ